MTKARAGLEAALSGDAEKASPVKKDGVDVGGGGGSNGK